MINKLTITPIVGLIFGLLAFFKVVLPDSITQEVIIGVVLLGGAGLTTVMRYCHGDADDNGEKIWYQSKVLWTQFGAFLCACLALAGVTIPGLDPDTFAASMLTVATALTLLFGMGNKKAIL